MNNLALVTRIKKSINPQARCNLLNNNPVLVARHFQYNIKDFSKKLHLMDHWEKQNIMLYIMEFQERSSPHVDSFVWIINAPNIPDETAYNEFIEKTINNQLPENWKDQELLELVKTYQVDSITCWKYIKNECCFWCGRYLIEKTVVSKPLDSDLEQ